MSEGACLLLTQVKTRDATASKKYFIFSLKIYPPYLPLFTAVWREGGSGSQILQLVCCYFMNEGFTKKNEGSQLCSIKNLSKQVVG